MQKLSKCLQFFHFTSSIKDDWIIWFGLFLLPPPPSPHLISLCPAQVCAVAMFLVLYSKQQIFSKSAHET